MRLHNRHPQTADRQFGRGVFGGFLVGFFYTLSASSSGIRC
jgi:hypothetical protein